MDSNSINANILRLAIKTGTNINSLLNNTQITNRILFIMDIKTSIKPQATPCNSISKWLASYMLRARASLIVKGIMFSHRRSIMEVMGDKATMLQVAISRSRKLIEKTNYCISENKVVF